MPRRLSLFSLCLTISGTLLLAARGLGEQSFYVSTAGNDAWSGTLATPNAAQTDGPFASPTRARDAVRQWKAKHGSLKEAVRVQIRSGAYYLGQTITLGPDDSGTAECPISYEAFPGEQPVLSGGQRITAWQAQRGKVLRAMLPDVAAGKWHFRSLFADGKRQVRARCPNVDPADPYRKGFFYADRDPNAFGGAAGSPTQFRYAPGTFQPAWAKAPDAEVHIFQSGACRAFKEIVLLKGVDEATRTVTVRGKECGATLNPGDRYFVENVPELLDSPGEWHLNRQTGELLYWPQGELTEKTPVVAPRLGRVFQLLGDAAKGKPVAHVRIAGLTIQETDYSPDDGCEGYGMGNDGVVYLKDATGCSVENCTFRNIGKYAVCLAGGSRNAVTGNDVFEGAEGGVLLLGTAGNTVSDNHVHHCGAVYKHIGGVILEGAGTDDNLVAHNLIHDVSRYGISLKNAGSRNRIEFNRILNTNLETYDTGGIEVTQGDKQFRSGSIIRNNVVGDTIGYSCDGPKPVFLSWGIYLDSFAGGYTVTHNVAYRSAHGGLMLQGGKDNRVVNNVFVDGKLNQMHVTNFDNNATGLVLQRNIFYYTDPNAVLLSAGALTPEVIRADRNLYFHAGGKDLVFRGGAASFADWQKRGFDQNSLVADPLFVDPSSDNYALRPDSPAFKLGFEPIDTSKVGLLRPRCRCPIRPAGPDFGLSQSLPRSLHSPDVPVPGAHAAWLQHAAASAAELPDAGLRLLWLWLSLGEAGIGPETSARRGSRQPVEPAARQEQHPALTLTDTVSQHGITWTFSQKVRVGRFVNGDYYVVGPVTITSITPRPENGRNGSVLNLPPVNARSGFDSRVPGGRYDPKLAASLPIAMQPGDALVSSISVERPRGLPAPLRPGDRTISPVRSASVLTCLAEAAPADAFRPSYCDRTQKLYLARNLRRELLPSLPRVEAEPDEEGWVFRADVEEWAQRFQRPWIDTCFFGFDAPVEYMPHYGREVGRAVGVASLMLMLDFPQKEKEKLLVNFVQYKYRHHLPPAPQAKKGTDHE